MTYQINYSLLGKSFVLPMEIAEKLKMASDVQLRTALWIFSHSGEPIDAAQIAKKIGKPQSAVEEALIYWTSVDVLFTDAPPSAKPAQPQPAQPVRQLPELPEFAPSYEQIMQRIKESPELESFFLEIQRILGKTVGYDGQGVFLLMHDSYGLPFEVIFMLVNYCAQIGKPSYRYMSKLARAWGEKEIDTIEKADAAIENLTVCGKVWAQFSAMTGIRTPKPTAAQEAYLLKWINEYRFSVEMLYRAYEIMAENCAKISFKYMDAVLARWFAQNVRTPQDIEKASQPKKASKPPEQAKKPIKRSYDMQEIERRAEELPVYKSGKESTS